MNISDFSKNIKEIIDKNEFLNANLLFGQIKNNDIINMNINKHIYNRFKTFISSKYDMKEKTEKIYYYNDMKLYSINDSVHMCIRSLPSTYYDFYVINEKNNYRSNIRLIDRNYRMIDNINFPSLINYDNIDVNNINYCTIKYKNSEIILEFIENNDILSINLKTKIDKYNVNNFIQNFQFIISKFYMKRFNLDQSYKTEKINKY